MELHSRQRLMGMAEIDAAYRARSFSRLKIIKERFLTILRCVMQAGRRLRASYKYQRDYERLLALPDYLLRDIGIDRNEIHVARQKAGRSIESLFADR